MPKNVFRSEHNEAFYVAKRHLCRVNCIDLER